MNTTTIAFVTVIRITTVAAATAHAAESWPPPWVGEPQLGFESCVGVALRKSLTRGDRKQLSHRALRRYGCVRSNGIFDIL